MDINEFREFGRAAIDFLADYFENIRERSIDFHVNANCQICASGIKNIFHPETFFHQYRLDISAKYYQLRCQWDRRSGKTL